MRERLVIHNLKTLKKKDDVKEYIDETLLKLVSSKLEEGIYRNTWWKKKENNIIIDKCLKKKKTKVEK